MSGVADEVAQVKLRFERSGPALPLVRLDTADGQPERPADPERS